MLSPILYVLSRALIEIPKICIVVKEIRVSTEAFIIAKRCNDEAPHSKAIFVLDRVASVAALQE